MVNSRGHSLVELIVALTVLSLVVGSAMSGAFFAWRATGSAIRLQQALAVTGAVLDSLLAQPTIVAGAESRDRFEIRWDVAPVGAGARIVAGARLPGSDEEVTRLEGFWIPPVAVTPVESPAAPGPADR